ncbi:uncharacterized protein BJ212DRAFT_1304174 [Suillus subaureus]|uniref:Uncharacterized protein n=1 Tax=Suillus subaureus TaxID=48587 RepID=A0A9P7DX10_9AGAM|nr:uncharacterized protein BJ212DRAFT_1304174 [Suillus subaureus]KAG1805225.1 hypothetical protein BJ212DRAFT_1304174 [Suillus subaureus]
MAPIRTQSGRGKHADSLPPSPSKLLAAKLLVAKAKKAARRPKVNLDLGDAVSVKKAAASSNQRVVNWSDPNMSTLMDKLLTVISKHVTYKVAFGFDKGDARSVNSSGKKVKEHTERIAEKVLLLDTLSNEDPTSRWKDIKISKLSKSIYHLKESYSKHYQELGQTGQGLLTTDHQHKITPGTPLANMRDKILQEFPWYLQMQELMTKSPIIDKSALLNSSTLLDLGPLHRAPLDELDSESPSHALHMPNIKTPAKTSSFTSSSSARPMSASHRNPATAFQEMALIAQVTQLKVMTVSAKEKTCHENAKAKAMIKLECLHLQHQRDEAEHQRVHEREMLQARIKLACMEDDASSDPEASILKILRLVNA